jgi:predicted PurR-regulated permease PerM
MAHSVNSRQRSFRRLCHLNVETRQSWSKLTTDIYHALGGYVLGQLTIVFIQMLVTSFWLFIMRVPYFLALGVLSGAASLIPFAGATVMGLIVSLLAWGTQGLWTGAATAAYYVAYQQFENHILAPIVYRRTVQMNPLIILLAALFMFDLAGIPGAVLAVPLVASGQIVVQTVLRNRRERLNIPPTPPRPELLEEADRERQRPGDGGHTLS